MITLPYMVLIFSAARVLKSDDQVQEILANLTVVSMDENPNAVAPEGKLFQRFKSKMFSLPQDQRETCLAFHGTQENNIESICKKGYNPKLQRRQRFGKGEYFATTPNISMKYCDGGKMLLLNELLLGQQGKHSTWYGDILVMTDPAHSLPRYVITFQ